MHSELFSKIIDAVSNSDGEAIVLLAKEVVNSGVDPISAIKEGYTMGMKRLGERFENGEVFLPEMLFSATNVKKALAILQKEIPEGGIEYIGKMVIGTVEGDVHDIGKDLVAMLVSAQGIEVHDLGVDCSVEKFIEKAIEVNAEIIGASCLLTMTVPENKKLLKALEEKGLRDRFKVIIGGAAISKELAGDMGADGYAEDAQEAVVLIYRLLKNSKGE